MSFGGDKEELIALVRKYPELYDHNHAKYHDAKYKTKIWKTIGVFFEEDGVACKNCWKNIRDQHRKNIKKHGRRNNKLSFLTEHADAIDDIDQDSHSSTLPPTSNAQLNEESAQDSNYNYRWDELIVKDEPIELEPMEFNSTATDPVEAPPVPVPNKIPIKVNRRLKRPASKRQVTQNPDTVDEFLAGIVPALKNLSPHYWIQAKGEIFAIVHKYELKMLTEPSPLFYPDRRTEGYLANLADQD